MPVHNVEKMDAPIGIWGATCELCIPPKRIGGLYGTPESAAKPLIQHMKAKHKDIPQHAFRRYVDPR